MKIRIIETMKGRPEYKKGEVYEFKGKIEEGYAKKYIERGWAEDVNKAAVVGAEASGEQNGGPPQGGQGKQR